MWSRPCDIMLLSQRADVGADGNCEHVVPCFIDGTHYIQGCLETWDALWSDLGYDGRILVAGGDGQEEALSGGPGEEYVQSCRSRYSEAMGRSVPEEQTSIRYECSQDLQSLAMSVGCYEYSPNGLTLDPTAN